MSIWCKFVKIHIRNVHLGYVLTHRPMHFLSYFTLFLYKSLCFHIFMFKISDSRNFEIRVVKVGHLAVQVTWLLFSEHLLLKIDAVSNLANLLTKNSASRHNWVMWIYHFILIFLPKIAWEALKNRPYLGNLRWENLTFVKNHVLLIICFHSLLCYRELTPIFCPHCAPNYRNYTTWPGMHVK